MTDRKIKIWSSGNNLNSYSTIKYGAIQTNMWNCNSINGEVSIELDNNVLITDVNLTDADIKQRTIFGYPEITLGLSLMGQSFNKTAKKTLDFPMKLSSLINENIKMVTDFQIDDSSKNELIFNISYDFWIKRDPLIRNRPESDDCEIMIWIYHSKQRPIGVIVDRFNLDCNLNGKKTQIPVDIWKGRGARWLTISFLFDRDMVPESAEISFELKDIFRVAINFMENTDPGQFLMGIELGTEFGNPDSRSTLLHWKLKKYIIENGKKKYNILKKC